MEKYIICGFKGYDFKIPKYINSNSDSKLDLFLNPEEFKEVIREKLSQNDETKIYIGNKKYFYQIFNELISLEVNYSSIIKPTPNIKNITLYERNYLLREEFLTNPSKPLDEQYSKENLEILSSVLNKNKINMFLIFGTLLGAMREKSFIKHDSDVDVGMYYEDKEHLLKNIWQINEAGLDLVRLSDNLISFMRNENYIDIYFFKKRIFPKYGWNCEGYFIPYKHLKKLTEIQFYGKTYLCPFSPENYLRHCYGSTWKTPIKDKHAKPGFSLNLYLRNLLPMKVKMILKQLWKSIKR